MISKVGASPVLHDYYTIAGTFIFLIQNYEVNLYCLLNFCDESGMIMGSTEEQDVLTYIK